MRFRFIHTPDFHRDMPFMGMRRVYVYSRLVATLRDATTPAFDNLVKSSAGTLPRVRCQRACPQQRRRPFGEVKSEQVYVGSLPEHYRQKWEKEGISTRALEAEQQARTSLRARLSQYVEGRRAPAMRPAGAAPGPGDAPRTGTSTTPTSGCSCASTPCGAKRTSPSASAKRRSPRSRTGRTPASLSGRRTVGRSRSREWSLAAESHTAVVVVDTRGHSVTPPSVTNSGRDGLSEHHRALSPEIAKKL